MRDIASERLYGIRLFSAIGVTKSFDGDQNLILLSPYQVMLIETRFPQIIFPFCFSVCPNYYILAPAIKGEKYGRQKRDELY